MSHRAPFLAPLLSLIVLFGTACGETEELGTGGRSPESETVGATDASLRAAIIHLTQLEASDSHSVRTELGPGGEAELRATTNTFEARFDAGGISVGSTAQDLDTGSLSLTRVGCSGSLAEVSPAVPNANANRVTYERHAGSITFEEWFLAGPLGIEQGFVIDEAPACLATSAKLVLELDVSGFDAQLEGDSIALLSAAGSFRYGELFASDASGRELPSRLAINDGRIELHIDATGATLPIEIDPLLATQVQKFWPGDVAEDDWFGREVAISGDTAVISSMNDDDAGTSSGSVYVYVRSGSVWTQQQKLVSSLPGVNGLFGFSLALSGDTALIGAVAESSPGVSSAGAAYVFVRSGSVWSLEQRLVASDGALADQFGYSVALEGDTAVVGAPTSDPVVAGAGSAYVFVRSGTVWGLQQKLVAADPAQGDQLATSVALSGDSVILGAPSATIAPFFDAGAAYIFTRSGSTWTQQQKITSSDITYSDDFGRSVAIDGDTAFVCALSDDNPVFATDGGSVYVFTRSGGAWTQAQKLFPTDAQANMQFGWSMQFQGDRGIVGAYREGTGIVSQAGAAYTFLRSGSVWTQQQKVITADRALGDWFGFGVALDGDTAMVGAYPDDVPGVSDAGSVYAFSLQLTGPACTLPSECPSGFCVDGVCCNTACGGGVANDCQACSAALGATADGICTLLTAATCNDGDACTQADTCQAGVCVGASPVVCGASDQCHDVGTCNPATGICSDPTKADGAACSDGDACTQSDTCQAGVCTGDSPVVCAASDQCHDVGVCDPASGACSNPQKADGVACDDGDACSQTDTCQAGACTGISPVICTASDQCHGVGVCNPASGACSEPTKEDGSACDDGDACSQTDTCQAGACTGGEPVACAALDACHDAGVCDGAMGECSNPVKDDGAPCPGGSCVRGECVADPVGGAGGDGGAGGEPPAPVGGSGEGGDGAGPPPAEEGCDCRVAGDPYSGRGWVVLLGIAVVLGRIWRRR